METLQIGKNPQVVSFLVGLQSAYENIPAVSKEMKKRDLLLQEFQKACQMNGINAQSIDELFDELDKRGLVENRYLREINHYSYSRYRC